MFQKLLAVLALVTGASFVVAADTADVVVGSKAPASTLYGLDAKSVKFDSMRGRSATVVVFVSFDCPVSTSYLAELNELAKTHAEKGVAVLFVCPTDESRETVAKAASGFKLTVPVLLDPRKEFAAGLKARATPEAFLLDAEGMVRYRGRIDDAYSTRLKRNREITSRDLLNALDAVLAGKPVQKPVTTPIGCAIDLETPAAPKLGAVTFYKDVAPILNNHCVTCHRPGEVAPFSLTTYGQARRWAGDIKEYTENRQMPPWMPAVSLPMKGERKLTAAEIGTLAAWADAGAPEGDSKDAPKAPEYGDGWRHGKPDLILTPDSDFHLAGTGNDLFRVFVIPTGLTENKWVIGYDVKPGNPRVVHHTLNFFDGSGQGRQLEKKQKEKDKGLELPDRGPGYNVAMGVGFVAPPGKAGEDPKFGGIGGWAPGQAPQFLPSGAGWLLPKNSDFLIQTHYHRNGQATDDRTQIGLYFAKEPIDLPWQSVIVQGLNTWNRIPAGSSDYVSRGSIYFHSDAVLHNVLPHMHLLGKSVVVTMTSPGEKPVVLVDIPAWDYRWQETYWFKEPIQVKAGTKLEIQAHFDNSEANPNNPTKPPRKVSYGEQTTDEMLFGFFGVTSAVKPSRRVIYHAYPPEGSAEPLIAGKLTPLLEGLEGTWDTATDVKLSGLKLNVTGKDFTKKSFGGTFIRSESATDGDSNRGLVYFCTFDPVRDCYRMWMYFPFGAMMEWTGTYDEKTKTMTWTVSLGEEGDKGVMHWKFAPSGGYTWDLAIAADGKTTMELSGDRTKKKP